MVEDEVGVFKPDDLLDLKSEINLVGHFKIFEDDLLDCQQATGS